MQYLTFRSVFLIATLLIGSTLLVGCDSASFEEGDGTASPSAAAQTSQVKVQITGEASTNSLATFTAQRTSASSSAEIQEAIVTIASIELVGEDARHLLSEEEQTFDLLELEDAVEDLALGEVPSGEYDRLLLEVTETQLTVSGEEQNLKVPSGKIKLLLPDLEIDEGGDEAAITVAFDTEESFVKAGKSGKYIFKPVVRTESVEVNGEDLDGEVEVAGEITGYTEGERVQVEGLTFAVTSETEIGEELTVEEGQLVKLEGSKNDDSTYVAQEIEARESDSEETGAVLEAPLGDVRPDERVVELLGQAFEVTQDTKFEGFASLADLASSRRVEVVFEYDGSGGYRLLEIEAESSEEEGEGEDEKGEDERAAAEVTGAITSPASEEDDTLAVAGLAFGTTGGTEVEGAEDLQALEAGQRVQLEATYTAEGRLIATEVEVVEGEGTTLEAAVESRAEGSLTLLGTTFEVGDETELEGAETLSDIEQGDEVEVAFTYDEAEDVHRATKIEVDDGDADRED